MVTPRRDSDTCAPWIVVCLWLGLQDLVRPEWPASVCLTEMGGWVCLPFSGYDVRGSDADRTGLVGGAVWCEIRCGECAGGWERAFCDAYSLSLGIC
jgi:hypothetical protein